jgi:site-specific DNA recombinase
MATINAQLAKIVTYPHVALYTRISKDKYGNAETCFDQEAIGRRYSALTWPGLPIVVYSDPDLSAFDDTVYRPGYEALKEAIAAGLVLHVWSVEQTRLERLEVPWFQMAALLDSVGIELLHTHREGIIRVQDEVAGIKAVLGAAEVRKMKKRQADKFDAHAARGIPPGSRPFGYMHGVLRNGDRTYIIVEEQAAVIREAAGLVLDGWSLENIARLLRERGVQGGHRVKVKDAAGRVVEDEDGRPVTRPTQVTGATVKGMLTNRAVAGICVRRNVEVGDGNWTPILDKTTWRLVCAKLGGDRQVTTVKGRTYVISAKHRGRTPGRRYLLTGGKAVCGVCAAAMAGSDKQLRNKSRGVYSVPYYFCHPKYGGKSCVGIMAVETEDFVVAELFDEIRRQADDRLIDDGSIGAQRDKLVDDLAELDEQRKDLARMWTQREIKGVEWKEARAGLDAEQHELEAQLRALPTINEGRDPAQILADWAEMTLDERRAVVDDYIEKVVIVRARPGLQRFDSDRVKVTFKERVQL